MRYHAKTAAKCFVIFFILGLPTITLFQNCSSGQFNSSKTDSSSTGASISDVSPAEENYLVTPPESLPSGLRWSDSKTWGGSVPQDNTVVIIPAGKTIILDTQTAKLSSLEINGTLVFNDSPVALTAGSIVINSEGSLVIGSPNRKFNKSAVITLTDSKAYATGANKRGITVNGGRLEIHGEHPQPLWTRLTENVNAGANQLTLESAVNWSAGDLVVVSPTDFYTVSNTESMNVASVSGRSITLNKPLAASRWGRLQYITPSGVSLTQSTNVDSFFANIPRVLDERAIVANLSRKVVIQGADDDEWRTNSFGAHIMIMNLKSRVLIDGVELRRVGQAGLVGRYPIHWHMLSYDVSGNLLGDTNKSLITNSSVYQSNNRCVVLHATNGVQVRNNICFDIKGHAYFLEDAVERRNIFDGNIALKIRSPASHFMILQHERDDVFQGGPSGFWLTNPDNTVTNNIAADARGNGFWLSFPRKPTGLSKNVALIPDRTPFGIFSDNITHSNREVGINIDWVATNDTGAVTPNRYMPTVDGVEEVLYGPQSNQLRNELKRVTAYKNMGGAIWNRVQNPDYVNWISADNVGVNFAGAGEDGLITRSVLIGTSLNNLSPYPNIWPGDPPSAFATYHSTFSMRDNLVINFPFVAGKSSGAFRTNDYYTNGIDKGSIRNSNNRLIASSPGYRTLPPNMDGSPLANRHWTYAGALWDPHGYWGTAGNFWVYNIPFLTAEASCTLVAPAGQNGASCNGEYYSVQNYQTDFDMRRYSFAAPMEVTRQNYSTGTQIGTWSVADGDTSTAFSNMRHFAARNGGRYVLRFPGKANPRFFAATVLNAYRDTDSFLIGLPFDGNTPVAGYLVSGFEHNRERASELNYMRVFRLTNNLVSVQNSNGDLIWQDRSNNLVWIKFRGGLPYPNLNSLSSTSDENMYRPLSIVLRSAP